MSTKVDMKIIRLNRLSFWLAIALAMSVGIIFLQAKYIRALQIDAEQLAARGTLKDVVAVPDVDAFNLLGKRVLVSYSAIRQPTIIYVFRPGCHWCERNEKAINSLTTQVSNRYRVIGLSLSDDELAAFLQAHPASFPIYHTPSFSVVASLHLGTTPETIAVSPPVMSWQAGRGLI